MSPCEDLNLSKTALKDPGLLKLCGVMKGITTLDISWCKQLTTQALSELARLESIRRLSLRECTQLRDEALVAIIGGIPFIER